MTEESLFERSKKKWKKFQQRGRSPRGSPLPATNQFSAVPVSTRPSTSLNAPSTSTSPPPAAEASTPIITVTTPAIEAVHQVLPVNLWSKAFEKSSKETKKWIREYNLDLSGQANPEDHIKEITCLIQSNTLCVKKDGDPKINIDNQNIVFSEYIAGVVAFLTMAGDIAINFAPLQANVPWAIVKALLKIPVKQSDQMAALAGTVEWFTRIVRRGQLYELLYNTKTTDTNAVLNLHETLLDLYVAAIELLARSDSLIEGGMAKQTLNAILRPEQAEGLVADLFQKEQKLLQEIPACEASRSKRAEKQADEKARDLLSKLNELSSPLVRIDEDVTHIRKIIDEDRLRELLRFISPEGHGKSHVDIADSRIDDTGNWLIEHEGFRTWQAIPSSSTVLWLKGTIGTGKTYLTWRAIEYMKTKLEESSCTEGFAFFYCSRSAASMQDPLVILRSFVRQLFDKRFENSYNRLIQKCDIAENEGRSLGLKECKELILEFINLHSKSTIILDALDETSTTSTNHNLADILIDILDKANKPVKIFISSRPDREYLRAFKDTATIIVEFSNQQADVEKYLEDRLYSTSSFNQRQGDTQVLIRNVFSSKHNSMFRWIHLQVQRLETYTSHDAVKSWATTLPSTLTESYDQLFDDMRKHDEHDVALAERAIKWVICSFEPLRSNILLEAVRYSLEGSIVVRKDKQTEQQILSLCRDLLTIDPKSRKWVLPHASVAEYFELRSITLTKCDLFASKILLGHLMSFTPESSKDSKLGRPAQSFEEYAVYAWFMHIRRYDKSVGSMECAHADRELIITLKSFLGSPEESSDYYRRWVDSLPISNWIYLPGGQSVSLRKSELMPKNMALFAACRYGFYYTLRDWWEGNEISKEMALNKCEYGYKSTPLVHAAQSGCIPIFKHLLHLVGTDYPFSEIYNAMQEAIIYEEKDIATLLMTEAEIDINDIFGKRSETIVQQAARSNSEMLQWLIDQGWVDVNRESGTEYGTPLIAAASWNLQSVKILLKAGANANAVVECDEYDTALIAAASDVELDKTAEIIHLLLDNGADANQALKRSKYGNALEALICRHLKYSRNIQESSLKAPLGLLLKANANPTAISDGGDHGSALAAAAFHGLKEILILMIGATTRNQAIQCLRMSRHPEEYICYGENGASRWIEKRLTTEKYLTDEIGVDAETLHKIGLWDVMPEKRSKYKFVFTFKKDDDQHLV
ncbi:hypothetical protein GGI43DRAFT_383929 [Trichoderma evansii]